MAVLDLDLNPEPRALRVFGFAAAIVFGGLGWLALENDWVSWRVAGVAMAIGLFSLHCALMWPAANRPLYVVLSILVWPIGLVVSYVVLGVLFFLVFTPFGLLFRVIRRDALRLRSPEPGATYWVPYERRGTLERYFRQF